MKFCWTTLMVEDLDKSLKFYTEIVGLSVNRRFKPNAHMEIAFLGNAPTELELIQEARANKSEAKGISIGFMIDGQLEQVIERLSENGYKCEGEIQQPNPNIRFVYVKDPDGFSVQFVETVQGN